MAIVRAEKRSMATKVPSRLYTRVLEDCKLRRKVGLCVHGHISLSQKIQNFSEADCGYLGGRLLDLNKALLLEAFANDSVKLFLQAAANLLVSRPDYLV